MSAPLSLLISTLERLAPLGLAQSWDNVGLLVDPRRAGEESLVERVLLTIDATPSVVAEAVRQRVDCLVAYHPPLFRPQQRFSARSDVLLFAAIEHRFAVYSPHTALDSAPGGLNDWLLEGIGSGAERPVTDPKSAVAAPSAARALDLAIPVSLDELAERAKQHLGLSQLRIARAERHRAGALVQSVAVAAGAGGSLLDAARGVDVVLTGEMRHHDVLAWLAAGTSVLLSEHTHTERGYLPRFRERLLQALGDNRVDIWLSEADAEPLLIA